ncbi:unnamed protein product, partial [marine sediment metagenome]
PAEEGKLSKDEMDALLEATREDEQQEQQDEEEVRPEPAEPARRVQGYDFTQPSRFNKSALEKLRKINDELAQEAGKHVSRLLRTSVKVQLVSMEQMKWENMVEELGESAIGYLFRLDPLDCQGVATIDRSLAAICLDRMMGGSGEEEDEEATEEFTDLDVQTFRAFVRGFLDPLPELWQNIGEFQVELGGFVQDLAGLELFTPQEDLFQLRLLLQGSMGSGQVALSVPFQAVKSLPPGDEPGQGPTVAASEDAVQAGLRKSVRRTRVDFSVL